MAEQKKKRPADVLAGPGSMSSGLRARRILMEEGDITEEDPAKAFVDAQKAAAAAAAEDEKKKKK